MDKKYLLLDCNYLCYRARFSTGGLSHEGQPTGVIYGFLKTLSAFQDFLGTSDFIFCWDSNTSKRKKMYPEYKAHRDRDYSPAEIEFDIVFRRQMKKLRTTYLPTIGFRNIFIQHDYESDDILASIALRNLQEYPMNGGEGVIITRDKDLYQCITHNVSVCDPQTNKILTMQGFKKLYGIEPYEWTMVKAIAGCITDNVKGVKGVGEKTAIKYLTGKLTEGVKYFDITCPYGKFVFDRNLPLVELPMKGTKKFTLQEDELSEQGWKQVTSMLGMSSIRDRMPFGRRRKKR